jgi:cardiolipin synthase
MTHTAAPIILSCVHVVMALCVSWHVLIHRRAAGTSVAWIGLAWLSPAIGSVLYLLFGINRVRRRALILRNTRTNCPSGVAEGPAQRTDHLAPLERAGRWITGRAVQGGNAFAMLNNGDEAYPRMLAAIEAAGQSIALSSYLFRADVAGQMFIDALARAVRRGVAVRVLVDGIGSGYFESAAYRQLRRAGVPVTRFMHSPLPWRMPFLNMRNHRKVLCIDGRVAFCGGLNIGAENLTRNAPAGSVNDTHFMIEGPVVTQLVSAFADDWCFATREQLAGSPWFPAVVIAGEDVARVVTSGPDQDVEKLEFMILEAIACSRTSIMVMTPYFVPDDRLVNALALAAIRGIEVDVVLPERSNHRMLDWAGRAVLAPLIASGCNIWTHPRPFNHSKLMSVDGLWCMIGSANWDARSFRLNFELDVEIHQSIVVRQVESLIAAQCHTLLTAADLAARPVAMILRDSASRLLLPYL